MITPVPTTPTARSCSCSCHERLTLPKPTAITSSLDAYRLLRPILSKKKVEFFYVVNVNVKMVPIGRPIRIGQGSVSACLVHPREVFAAAVKRGAFAVIVAHCHPSGFPAPSDEDAALTRRLVAAGEVVGIKVLDHVIVGDDDYFSFSDAGRMAGA